MTCLPQAGRKVPSPKSSPYAAAPRLLEPPIKAEHSHHLTRVQSFLLGVRPSHSEDHRFLLDLPSMPYVGPPYDKVALACELVRSIAELLHEVPTEKNRQRVAGASFIPFVASFPLPVDPPLNLDVASLKEGIAVSHEWTDKPAAMGVRIGLSVTSVVTCGVSLSIGSYTVLPFSWLMPSRSGEHHECEDMAGQCHQSHKQNVSIGSTQDSAHRCGNPGVEDDEHTENEDQRTLERYIG